MLLLPPNPVGIRTLTDEEASRLRERHPDVPKSPKDCRTCGGRKTFLWYDAEGKLADYECDCTAQWILHRYLLNANVLLGYQQLRWADADHVEAAALAKAKSYAEDADQWVRAGLGLILYGSTAGTGKTLLASLILKHLLGLGYDGYFTTFSEMIDTYTGGWYDTDEKRWFHRRIKNVRILVIDDVGKEWQGRTKSDLPAATIDEVIRHRVANLCPTIITTNKSMTALTEGYGGYVLSLLRESSTTYHFEVGSDFREAQRLRRIAEAEQGITRPITIG